MHVKELDFGSLEALRQELIGRLSLQPAALNQFFDESTGSFKSNPLKPNGHISTSSTATCIVSLVTSGQWRDTDWSSRSVDLAGRLLGGGWITSGLPPKNVYTTAFVLEAVDVLAFEVSSSGPRPQPGFDGFLADENSRQLLDEACSILQASLEDGSARIGDYPPSAYITQLALRVLKRRGVLTQRIAESVEKWAWSELARQLALILAKSKTADYFQLAYAAVMLGGFDEPGRASPEQRLLLDVNFFMREILKNAC